VPNTYISQGLVAIAAPYPGETTPNYSLNKAHSGSDTFTASTNPLTHQPRRPKPFQLSGLDPLFMRFRGLQAQMEHFWRAK
jgi:hypothetical protein